MANARVFDACVALSALIFDRNAGVLAFSSPVFAVGLLVISPSSLLSGFLFSSRRMPTLCAVRWVANAKVFDACLPSLVWELFTGFGGVVIVVQRAQLLIGHPPITGKKLAFSVRKTRPRRVNCSGMTYSQQCNNGSSKSCSPLSIGLVMSAVLYHSS